MDIEHELLNLRFSVARLQSLLELMMRRCANAGIEISRQDVETANEQALAFVQRLYPNRKIGENFLDYSSLDS